LAVPFLFSLRLLLLFQLLMTPKKPL